MTNKKPTPRMHALRQYKYTHVLVSDGEPCRYANIRVLLTKSDMERIIKIANREGRSVHDVLESATLLGLEELLKNDEEEN